MVTGLRSRLEPQRVRLMNVRLEARASSLGQGPQHAQAVQRMLRDELTVVRAAATAWRNGLAGLLAAMLGFSLVKGRSDIGTLACSRSPASRAPCCGTPTGVVDHPPGWVDRL